MYLDHFGLRESPFRITPHTEFFFSGANRGATLDALIYAITHDEGIVKVSGEVGSGKTMLCRVLLERLPANVVTVYLANPSLSRDDILFALADELSLDVPTAARSAQIIRLLQEHLICLYAKGHQVVVLIDEAHAMPLETLEEIRLLSNLESNRHKLLQIVMFGQPELNEILSRSDMRQLKERITHNFTLGPLGREETAEYIDFRLRAAGYKGASIFAPAAINMIAAAALGLTRRINIIADKALLSAYAASKHEVGPEEAKAAIQDCDFSSSIVRTVNRNAIFAGIGVVSLMAALWLTLSHQPTATPSTPVPQPPAVPVNEAKPVLAQAESVPTLVESSPLAKTPVAQTPATSATNPSPATEATSYPFGPLTRHHLQSGQQWLVKANNSHWFIQILAINPSSAPQVEVFLKKLSTQVPPDQIRVYLAKRDKTERIGVIYGEYESQSAAQAAIAQLPAEVRSSQPYPRQVQKLR
ncbi:MAG: AAA family ATPase [Rhodocyclaceae bacterium]|nr:AAA family ATPase [Rhodocyclaceae bacterium]